MVNISSGCRIDRFKIASPPMPPAAATGIARRIIIGKIKLRSKITKSRKITKMAVNTLACMAFHVIASALAAPSSLIVTPLANASVRMVGKISLSITFTTSSSDNASVGRSRIEIACRPPSLRICSGALITSIFASCLTRKILPSFVTMGMSCKALVVRFSASFPETTISINSPSIGT